MSKLFDLAAVFIMATALTGSAAGLSFNQPDSEVFDKYTEDSEGDIEEEIEEKVDTKSDEEEVNIEEEIEERLDEETEEIKERKSQKVTGQATEMKSGGFFSRIMSIFGR